MIQLPTLPVVPSALLAFVLGIGAPQQGPGRPEPDVTIHRVYVLTSRCKFSGAEEITCKGKRTCVEPEVPVEVAKGLSTEHPTPLEKLLESATDPRPREALEEALDSVMGSASTATSAQ